MSGRLQLRRGVVVEEDPLTVEVGGERRRAWADTGLLGEMREGDEVIVNVAAVELGLGSGGFDVVHANLTRGLDPGRNPAGKEGSPPEPHVIKLNYTSLQHPVDPIEVRRLSRPRDEKSAAGPGVLVLPLHGHLAPAAWAVAQGGGGAGADEGAPAVGYVQTGGGALPGSLSRDVAELRERGLLAGHVTAAPAYGGEQEAISVAGALDTGTALGWDLAVVGPGPGIIGSDTALGHGGMVALDSAHASLALGLRTLLSPRLSSADPRPRHLHLSHHTASVLELLLAPVEVVFPAANGELPGWAEARAGLDGAAAARHRLIEREADLSGYAESGLPRTTMGRDLDQDPLFFAAALAAGTALGEAATG